MIRWSIIFLALAVVAAIGLRDWYKALVAVVVLSVLHEHHYFRDPFLNIPGLRMINLMLPVVLLQYLLQRRREGLVWDPPLFLSRGVIAYAFVLLYGVLVALPEFHLLQRMNWTATSFAYNEVFAPAIPLVLAALLYDGTRSQARLRLSMAALVIMALISAIYIIKIIPPSSLMDAGAFLRYRLRIQREFGLHPNDVISILVPGIWVSIACILLVGRRLHRFLLGGAALMMFVALLLTQSRTGMLALVGVTAVLGLVRFRLAGLGLVLAAVAVLALPSIAANWSRGLEVYTIEGRTTADFNEVTNGRIEMWKLAWQDILDAPVMGHGRLYWWRMYRGHEAVWGSHPHNVYLEIWMEYGAIGLLVILAFAVSLLVPSFQMLRRDASRLEVAAGLGAVSCLLTHFIVGFSGRAFLPRVSSVITMCMCALALRVFVSMRTVRSAVAAASLCRRAGSAGAQTPRMPALRQV